MKHAFRAVTLLLALNFLLTAGAVGWMYQSGRLDRQKMSAIRELVFPHGKDRPTTQPSHPVATTQPVMRLEELLAKCAGRPATEQLEYIRTSFDSQMAQLERAQRDLMHLQGQVMAEKQKLVLDRAALEQEKQKLAAKEKESQQLANDKGFQDSLAMYESLPPKTVKTIFMSGMDDQTVIQYLQAMESRTAGKVMKEFKTPEEIDRLKKILEKMRQPQTPAAPAQASANTTKE